MSIGNALGIKQLSTWDRSAAAHIADGLDSYYGRVLGLPSAIKGGHARAKSLTRIQRSKIASKAAKARWSERASIPASMNKPIDFSH